MMAADLHGEAGLTLAELLVALAVTTIVLAGAGTAFQIGSSALTAGSDQAEAQQNARWVLERMVEEIRGAGYDPIGKPGSTPPYNFPAVANQTATQLTLQSDFNADGVAAAGPCDAANTTEVVRWRLLGTELRRSTNPANAACDDVVVSGVQTLAFTYRDAAGNVTADPWQVTTIEVALTTTSEGSVKPRSAVMTDRVRLRNR